MSFSIFLFAALEPTELPCFKMPLQNAMARVGQKIKLEALVTGIPRPEIAWLHNGKPFQPRDSKVSTITYDKLIARGKRKRFYLSSVLNSICIQFIVNSF